MYFTATILAPLLALHTLLLIWLVLALFLPHRYAQPRTRALIGVPYLLATIILTLDPILHWFPWFTGVRRGVDGVSYSCQDAVFLIVENGAI